MADIGSIRKNNWIFYIIGWRPAYRTVDMEKPQTRNRIYGFLFTRNRGVFEKDAMAYCFLYSFSR